VRGHLVDIGEVIYCIYCFSAKFWFVIITMFVEGKIGDTVYEVRRL